MNVVEKITQLPCSFVNYLRVFVLYAADRINYLWG